MSNVDKVPMFLAFSYSHDQNGGFYFYFGKIWDFGMQNINFINK